MGLHARLFILYACDMKRDTPIDWPAIKTAYITGSEGQQELAKRFGVSRSRLAELCRKEGWVQLRAAHRTATVQKATQKASRAQADALAKIVQASDILDQVLLTLFERLNAEGLAAISGNGMPGKELESLSRALLNNDELKRRLNGKMMPRDEARIKLDREKWEAEQKRMEAEKNSNNTMRFELSDDLKELAQ